MAPAVKNGNGKNGKNGKKTSLASKVRAIALEDAETKIKVWKLLNNQVTVGSGLAKGDTTVTPSILTKGVYLNNIFNATDFNMLQGTSQQTRVGNSIRDCKLNIRGFVSSNPASSGETGTNDSSYPFECHVLIYKASKDPLNNPNTILQDVNNTNTYITGSAVNSLFPFNRKGYTIKKHLVYRMKANAVVATSTQANALGLINPNTSMTGSFYKRFNVNIAMKDKLLFDDDGRSPTNEWMAIAVYVINGDGVILQQTQQRVTVSAYATLRYKDD